MLNWVCWAYIFVVPYGENIKNQTELTNVYSDSVLLCRPTKKNVIVGRTHRPTDSWSYLTILAKLLWIDWIVDKEHIDRELLNVILFNSITLNIVEAVKQCLSNTKQVYW